MPAGSRTGRARPAGRHAPPDRRMRSPCRSPRQVSGAVQPAIWELSASSVLKAMRPCGQPERRGGYRRGRPDPGRWPDTRRRAGHRLGGQRSRDGDAVLFAGAPLVVRDVPGQRGLPDAGRAAVRPLEGQRQDDECPFAPGWRACSSCAWPNCPAGDNPTAAATTLDGRAGLYIDGGRGNQPGSSHGRRHAQPDREQPRTPRRTRPSGARPRRTRLSRTRTCTGPTTRRRDGRPGRSKLRTSISLTRVLTPSARWALCEAFLA